MAEHTIPVLPVTHPASGYGPTVVTAGYRDCGGLQSKDAAFLSEIHNQTAHRDNIVEVLANRFESERAMRDVTQLVERLERENQKLVFETQLAVRDDGEKTRNLILDGQNSDSSKELADIKLKLALLEYTPKVCVPVK